MRIWIDLANSPHVLFFYPLIQLLHDNGHDIFISIRDFAQTVDLCHNFGISGEVIGEHGGTSIHSRMINLVHRTAKLVEFAKNKRPDIALSHNSYTQALAGRLIGTKVVTIMDYEGQPANHLAFRIAHKVIVPEVFPEESLRRFGVRKNKVYKYNGFKEQLYISDFVADKFFIEKLIDICGIKHSGDVEKKIIVTVRTPPTMALYHHYQNLLFNKVLAMLNQNEDILGIVLPRNERQETEITRYFSNLYIPSKALEGLDLILFSDLLISAGGTMNREAAILGTPVYSVFMGFLPAVDSKLIKMGRMIHITEEKDLYKIRLIKKHKKGY